MLNVNAFRNQAYLDEDNAPKMRVLDLIRQNLASQSPLNATLSNISYEDKSNIDKFIMALNQALDIVLMEAGNNEEYGHFNVDNGYISNIVFRYNQLMYYTNNVAQSNKQNINSYLDSRLSTDILAKIQEISEFHNETKLMPKILANIETQNYKSVSISLKDEVAQPNIIPNMPQNANPEDAQLRDDERGEAPEDYREYIVPQFNRGFGREVALQPRIGDNPEYPPFEMNELNIQQYNPRIAPELQALPVEVGAQVNQLPEAEEELEDAFVEPKKKRGRKPKKGSAIDEEAQKAREEVQNRVAEILTPRKKGDYKTKYNKD